MSIDSFDCLGLIVLTVTWVVMVRSCVFFLENLCLSKMYKSSKALGEK